MRNAKPITAQMIERFQKNYEKDKTAKTFTAAAAKTVLSDVAFSPMDAAKLENSFSIEIPTRGTMDQKKSGRCWLFASMNIMRELVAKNCNMEKFELSGNYLAFWDKFEKMNFFLESIIDSADLEVSDRTVNWILSGLNDGGQWDMMVSLIQKYGIVPSSVMPETFQSSNTHNMSQILNMKLRKDAIELRALVKEGNDPSERKEEMLEELFRALCICFGRPVERFDFAYTDKERQYHIDYDLTPHSFYEKYIKLALEDYVSVIHAPTKDKPYGKTYTVKYLGNVVEGKIRYLNLPMEELKKLAVQQLKDGEAVWFGSDYGKYSSRTDGILDQNSFVYGEILGGLDLSMTKEERLDYRDSAMNHAMVLVGVNLDRDGRSNRWKIENSWGEEPGKKGYFIASDAWFDEFTYQVIIHKKYLTEEWKKALEEEPIELAPWDPMGSLA